jgi:heme exporter protein A
MHTENKIEIANLFLSREQQPLFSDLSLIISPSELLRVIGPNGSGKTTLLRLLAGFVTPTSGDIYWQNKSIYEIGKTYSQHLHYVSHSNGIKLGLTVFENLAFSNYIFADAEVLSQKKCEGILAQFQLIEFKNTQARFLSAGLRRRLSLAKLLLVPRPIWILDEPTTSLDKTIEALFLDLLKCHVQQGGIAIVSSHHDISPKDIAIKTLRPGS